MEKLIEFISRNFLRILVIAIIAGILIYLYLDIKEGVNEAKKILKL